jgi:hypothetical protein
MRYTGREFKINQLVKLIELIDQKFSNVPLEKQKQLEKTLVLSYQELVSFQELKAIAQAKGIINLETAMFIYNALSDWDNQTLGTKFILTKLHADLLKDKLKGAL